MYTIRRLVTDKKDLVKHNDINNEMFPYFKSLFKRANHIDKPDHNTLLQSITLPHVTHRKVVCHNDLTDKELFEKNTKR